MAETLPMANSNIKVNLAGLEKSDYRGNPTTLCQGCGHNSISNQIVAACYEMDVVPEELVKFSGIGCSSKSPTYFLNRSFGFNSLHGRMPSIATGALFADINLRGLGISGDGDSASIGKILGPALDEVSVVDAVEKVVQHYLGARSSEDETFLDCYRRLGPAPFKQAVYG